MIFHIIIQIKVYSINYEKDENLKPSMLTFLESVMTTELTNQSVDWLVPSCRSTIL